MRIALIGAGSWGTALAVLLAEGGHRVSLWARRPELRATLRERRENSHYLPGRPLPASLEIAAQDDPAAAVAAAGHDLVVVAVPSAAIRETARLLGPGLAPAAAVVCASKGLEGETRRTMDQVIAEELPAAPVVLLSGPTFAAEIAAGLPAAAVAASRDPGAATRVQQAFVGGRLRIYTTDDVVGVALGGALKNVIAIAAGCSDGLGFGNNTRAALITRGLHEMARLVTRLGGNPVTMAGLAGLGDLVLTCTGELSRNRKVGLALARGEPLAAITAQLGHVAEGVGTARVASELSRELAVSMPITDQVAALVEGRRSPEDAVADLLAREQGPERG